MVVRRKYLGVILTAALLCCGEGASRTDDARTGEASAGGPGEQGCGINKDNFFDMLAEALAAYLARCYGLQYKERPALRNAFVNWATEQMRSTYGSLLASGRLTLNASSACAALEILKTGDCSAADRLPEPFSGNSKPGDECYVDEECPSGYFCKQSDTCPGNCLRRASLGESCEDAKCEEDLSCGPTGLCQASTPTVYAKVGESCLGDNVICVHSYCNPGDGICHQYPGPGESCGYTITVCSMAWCDGQVCRKLKEEHEECLNSIQCKDGLTCVNGKCEQLRQVGEACTPNDWEFSDECATGICSDNGVCVDSYPAPSCHP